MSNDFSSLSVVVSSSSTALLLSLVSLLYPILVIFDPQFGQKSFYPTSYPQVGHFTSEVESIFSLISEPQFGQTFSSPTIFPQMDN